MAKRVVVITGASSGIGRSAAVLFGQKGWRVGLIARGAAGLQAAKREVEAAGGRAAVAVADVSDSRQLERAAAQIEAALGPIDVWVNNAGVGVFGYFLDIPEDEFRRVTEINYLGAVNGTRIALAHMLARDRGTIVQVASEISHRGVPLQVPYSASKFAVRGFTEALRAELIGQRSRIRLSRVDPPATNTPFYNHAKSYMRENFRPPPPVYQPEVVADAIYTAATSNRREIQVGAQTVATVLGNTVAPHLMDFLAGVFGIPAQLTSRGGAVAQRDPNLGGPGRIATAHGPFDGESPPSFLSRYAKPVALGLGLGALAWLGTSGGRRG